MSGRSKTRWGASSLEAIVGFTLLSTALAFATPLVVRHSRLLRIQRDYRLALEEVSNQLERLSILPAGELAGAVADLEPSELIADKLPGAKLRGELRAADIGQNLTLRLSWPGPQSSPEAVSPATVLLATVSLTTWLPPASPRRPQP